MIYLNNISYAQEVYIPMRVTPSGNSFQVLVSSQLAEGYSPVTAEFVKKDGQYAVLNITLPENMDNGDYEYMMTESGTVISKGCINISGALIEGTEYENNIQYEQYEHITL